MEQTHHSIRSREGTAASHSLNTLERSASNFQKRIDMGCSADSTGSGNPSREGKDSAISLPADQPSGNSAQLSWLPFPRLDANISWNELSDSDSDDIPYVRPVLTRSGSRTLESSAKAHHRLIPSFSGEQFRAIDFDSEEGKDDYSSRLESPTPVVLVQDPVSSSHQMPRTHFGFMPGTNAGAGFGSGLENDAQHRRILSHQSFLQLAAAADSQVELPVEPRLEVVKPDSRNKEVSDMITRAKAGLAAGFSPDAPREGTGGTYFLHDAIGDKVGIFKPCDEEPLAPNNPKGWSNRPMTAPGMKPSVRIGEAALREVAAYLLDHDSFAGVPPACLVELSHSCLNYTAPASRTDGGHSTVKTDENVPLNSPQDARLLAPASPGGLKLGSLQAFAPHTSDANDIASSCFSADSIHRVGILDIRLLNLDRHAGNLLVAEAPRGRPGGALHKLVPIDHGYALPEALDDPFFEWMYWPQASVPFSSEVKAYVAALDPDADIAMLRRELPALRPECLRCLQITTEVLKKCVADGLTLHEIARVFTRAKAEEASDFEAICMDAREEAINHSALPSLPSLPLSDLQIKDTAGLQSVCLGPFPFDDLSGELSPQSSLAMSGLLCGARPNGASLSASVSPFKKLPSECVSESPIAANLDCEGSCSPCMAAVTPTAGALDVPDVPTTPSWLRTVEFAPSPRSDGLVTPAQCFAGRASDVGGRVDHYTCGPYGGMRHLSARTLPSARSVWHSKRRVVDGGGMRPAVLSAVHPDKANYVFSGLNDAQWDVFRERVEDFVTEELTQRTWVVKAGAGAIAGSCPNP